MSKYIERIPLSSVERIAVLFGDGRSMAQVKGMLWNNSNGTAEKFQPDYIMNAGFYDMTTGKPVGHLKADCTVYARESWSCWGYAWDKADMEMVALPFEDHANYISGVPLLTPWDGMDAKLSYNAEVGGSRPRTAVALDGENLILYCADSPTTPEKLRGELHALGADTALMLDSGGSTQCDFNGKRISSSRRVHNYLAVWLKKTGSDPEERESDMSKKVVIDPGHGVETAGKRSPDGTYLEHEFNLDIAKRIKEHLERQNITAILTRSTEHDVTIADRANISNEVKPDLFVSIHSNASGDDWSEPDGYGIYTSVRDDTAERNKAAKAILARAKEAGITIWGGGLFHDGDDGVKDIGVLWKTNAPAVLIEHGFHTNKAEVELLKSDAYRSQLAEADAKGISDYLGIAWQENTAENFVGYTCPHCGGKLSIVKG